MIKTCADCQELMFVGEYGHARKRCPECAAKRKRDTYRMRHQMKARRPAGEPVVRIGRDLTARAIEALAARADRIRRAKRWAA